MVRAVQQGGTQTDQRIARQNAVLHCLAHALFDCRMEILRNAAAEDLFLEQEIALGVRRKFHLDVTVLTVTAGLLLVLAFHGDRLADFFAVRNGRILQDDLNAEFILELGADDIQMDIARAGENHLMGFVIGVEREGRILIVELCQTGGDLFLAALDLRCDALRVARLRERDARQLNRTNGHGQGVAGLGGDQLGNRADIAAGDLLDLGGLFAADRIDVTDLLGAAHACVEHRHIRLDRACNDLEVRESAVLIRSGLEYERTRCAVRCTRDFDDIILGLEYLILALIRGRHVVADALEQCIGADTGCRSAGEYRTDDAVADALTQTCNQLLVGELLAAEVAVHQILGQLRNVFAQRRTVLLHALYHVLRHRDFYALVAFHAVCLADDAVNNTDGLAVALEDRDNDRRQNHTELLLQLVQAGAEVRIFLVNLGNIEHARLARLLEALPCLFGADARTGFARNDDQTGIAHAQCTEHFALKVKVTRGIEQVDLASAELNRCNRGGN